MRRLKDWLSSYIKFTENTEPPYLFRVWVGMSVIAAALQRKCYLEWGHSSVYPNLFIALVGPSGVGKSQAMVPGRQLLREVGIKLAAESMTREALIRELKKSAIDHQDSEGRIHSHSSLTVHSSELTVFIGYQNKQLISDLCDLYECADRWEYRTKDPTKTDEIIGVYLNILGAITPTLLQAAVPLEAIGGGLTRRMICVYEEKKGKIVPAPFLTKSDSELRSKLIDDLYAINQMSGQFRITEGFLKDWIDWYVKAQEQPPFESQQFEGYFTTRPMHVLKMSMVISASESGSMIITEEHFRRAVDLLEKTEVNMSMTFEGVGKSSIGEVVTKLMRHIAVNKEVTLESLHRLFYHDADRRTMEEALRQLQAMGYCSVVYGGDKTVIKYKGGRDESKVENPEAQDYGVEGDKFKVWIEHKERRKR